MEFKQLQSFVAVVDYGSFTRASEKLFISQPTISTHIRQLEEEFQSCLLVRTTKSIELTPRGQEFYECAVSILSLKNHLIESWINESRNVIHLGTSTIPSTYLLPELLPAYKKQCPETYFNIHQSDSQGILDKILEGSFNLGLVGMTCEDERFCFEPFYQDQMVLITPKNAYFEQLKSSGTSIDTILRSEPLILREEGSGSRKFVYELLENLHIPESSLNVTARLNDQESIKNLVANGLGISVISKAAACIPGSDQKLLVFDLPVVADSRSLYLVYHKNYILKPYVHHFMEFVLHFYKKSAL